MTRHVIRVRSNDAQKQLARTSLKLCGIMIMIIATYVHVKRPQTRTELPARIVFHVALTSVDSYRCDSHFQLDFSKICLPPQKKNVIPLSKFRLPLSLSNNMLANKWSLIILRLEDNIFDCFEILMRYSICSVTSISPILLVQYVVNYSDWKPKKELNG